MSMTLDTLFQSYKQTTPPPIDTGTRVGDFFDEDYDKYYTSYETSERPSFKELKKKKKDEDDSVDFRTLYRTEKGKVTNPYYTPPSNEDNADIIGTSFGANLVSIARELVGSKYSWGGQTPSTGFDCSGFINYVYKLNGVDLRARTVKELEYVGQEVSLENVKLGDLICFNSSGPSGKHIKMVSRIDENGLIWTIEAKGKKYGVVETPLENTKGITTIRHINIAPAGKRGLVLNPYVLLMQEGGIVEKDNSSFIKWISNKYKSVKEAIMNYYHLYFDKENTPVESEELELPEELSTSYNYESLRLDYVDKLENPDLIGYDKEQDRWTRPTSSKYSRNQIGFGLDTVTNTYVVDFLKENGRTDNPWLTMLEMRDLQKKTFDYNEGAINRHIKTDMDPRVRAMLVGLVYHGYANKIWSPNDPLTKSMRLAIDKNNAEDLYYAIYNFYEKYDPDRARRHLQYWNEEKW